MGQPERIWIYHKEQEPKVINKDDLKRNEGWFDNPLTFFDLKSLDLKPDDKTGVNMVGLSIVGVCESLNGLLNLELMKPDEIVQYGQKHCGLDLNKKQGRLKMIKRIKNHMGA